MPDGAQPAVGSFLRDAFTTLDALYRSRERAVEMRLIFEAAWLSDATALASDLRSITRRPVRVRPTPMRCCWTLILVVEVLPAGLPLVRMCEVPMHDLSRRRPGCRFVGISPS